MSERRPSDSCRIRKSSFKVKFGNISGKQVYSLLENLFKPSLRKESLGVVLAEICSIVARSCSIFWSQSWPVVRVC